MNDILPLIFGALLAIIGGAVSDMIHAWMERNRELKAIKIAIIDELSDIEATIKNMHEVWEQTKVFAVKYVDDLLASMSTYDGFRSRLFLMKNKDLRKEVSAFYKKIKDTAKKSEGKVGTLADSDESKREQTAIEASFQALGTEAKSIKEKLEK